MADSDFLSGEISLDLLKARDSSIILAVTVLFILILIIRHFFSKRE